MGALDEKTKELLGLATSMVLKCDDGVNYHIVRCVQLGLTDEELLETLNVALVVGGSITIPHIRRAVETKTAAGSSRRRILNSGTFSENLTPLPLYYLSNDFFNEKSLC